MAHEQQPGKQLSAHGTARRRFTRAGAAASGVLLTLHSQPGMALDICSTPSGYQSGLVSARPNDPGTCAGRSPGYWKNTDPAPIDNGNNLLSNGNGNGNGGGNGNGNGGGNGSGTTNPDKVWPSGAKPTDLFSSVYFCTSDMSTTYGSPTCTLDWIMGNGPDFDKYELGAHLVACYLNVLAGLSGFQTVTMLQEIWNELRVKGYYAPTAGVQWDAPKVVEYLKGTMTA